MRPRTRICTASHRIIVTTTNHWSEHAEDALQGQNPPVTKIDLQDLENSQIDWSKYGPQKEVVLKPKKSPREQQRSAIQKVVFGLNQADRGKLIMACGTGKTFTSLKITLTGIPLEAYDYIVNGKPALDWVVERQCVKTDKDSGIVNDANDYAKETMNNPRYPLELFMRVITVSLETMKIVRGLPALEI